MSNNNDSKIKNLKVSRNISAILARGGVLVGGVVGYSVSSVSPILAGLICGAGALTSLTSGSLFRVYSNEIEEEEYIRRK